MQIAKQKRMNARGEVKELEVNFLDESRARTGEKAT